MGHGLQAGIIAITCSKAQTARRKMAPPRAGTSELEGSAPAGEDRVSRETCWTRREKVTETVTQGGKLIGVTETCTTRRQVTELTETQEAEERLHSKDGVEVEDAHTHTHTEVVRDNEGELAERVGTRGEQLVVLPREQGEVYAPLIQPANYF